MQNLDYVADAICTVLENNVNKEYAEEKRLRLEGLDRFKVLVWMNNLDIQNLEDVAHRLDVEVDDLDFVRKFVRNL